MVEAQKRINETILTGILKQINVVRMNMKKTRVRNILIAVVIILSLCISVLSPQQASAQDPSFSNIISLTSSKYSDVPDIAAFGSNVYVVWSKNEGAGDGYIIPDDMFFRKSTDNGVSFSDAVNLSDNHGLSDHPQIAAYNDNVYVVWQDDSKGDKEIFFRKSTDNGASFESTINLSNNSGDSESPEIIASGSNVYIIWRDSSPGNFDIFFRASNDYGATFGSTVNLSNNKGNSWNQESREIAVSGNNVYVVWQDESFGALEILLRRSIDNGANFEPVVNVSNTSGSSHHPMIATSGNSVYVVWNDEFHTGVGNDVFFRKSRDGGTTFDPTINLSNNGKTGYPKIAAFGNNVYVGWTGVSSQNGVFFTRSTDAGLSFAPAFNLGNTNLYSDHLRITSAGANVYVAWRENNDVLFRISKDGGGIFEKAVNLSNNGNSFYPQTALSGDRVYVLWIDDWKLALRIGTVEATSSAATSSTKTMQGQANMATVNFGDTVNVSNQRFGSVAAWGDNMYLLWTESKTQSDGRVIEFDVLFRTIKDDGSSLGSVMNLRSIDSNSEAMIANTDLTVSGSNVYVTWLETDITSDSSTPRFDIFVRVSNDSGATFSNAINLSNSGSVQTSYEIFAHDSNVYVTWIDSSPGNWDVLFRSSNDNGATWTPVVNLSNNAGMSAIQGSSISVSGDNVYVVWQDNSNGKLNTLFRASNNNGASFGSAINLGEKGISYRPAVASSGSNVHVAGLNDPTPDDDSRGPELNIVASSDNGRSFSNVVNLSERAEFPTIAAYGSNVYVKWVEIQGTYGPWQIFFSRSVDNGARFDSAIDLSGKIYNQASGEMIEYGSYVFVTWCDGSNVILRASNDSGATFQSKVNLSNGQSQTCPAMYKSEEKLYVVWLSNQGMSFRVAKLPEAPSNPSPAPAPVTPPAPSPVPPPPQDSGIPQDASNDTVLQETERVQISGTTIVDSAGNELTEVSTGSQLLVQGNLLNRQSVEQSLAYIVQIKDEYGRTVFLSWIKGSIQNGQSLKETVAWTPDLSGKYTVEIFVWDNLEQPMPLSSPKKMTVKITS